MNSDIIKPREAAKDNLNLAEFAIISVILGSLTVIVVSIAWILFIAAIVVTQKVLGV